MYKKAQAKINKVIFVATIVIISVVILMSLYDALVPEVQTAGDSMNDSNRCATVGCFYNASMTGDSCRNNA